MTAVDTFAGVIPPLTTPLTPDGDVDAASTERLCEFLLTAGVDGLFVCGSSGEVALLADGQRARVVEVAAGVDPLVGGGHAHDVAVDPPAVPAGLSGSPNGAGPDGSEQAISVHGLVKRYGEIEAVAGIDFAVARGELFGFLGPNGAGKTTTLRMLATLIVPDGGEAAPQLVGTPVTWEYASRATSADSRLIR